MGACTCEEWVHVHAWVENGWMYESQSFDVSGCILFTKCYDVLKMYN
jgi:hypothetical protein